MEGRVSSWVSTGDGAGCVSLGQCLEHPLAVLSPLAPLGKANSGLSFKQKIKNYCNLEILNSGAYIWVLFFCIHILTIYLHKTIVLSIIIP